LNKLLYRSGGITYLSWVYPSLTYCTLYVHSHLADEAKVLPPLDTAAAVGNLFEGLVDQNLFLLTGAESGKI
jgi:hypothetical protein